MVRDYLVNQKLSSALNIPISDMTVLKQIQAHLDLMEKIGIIQGQLAQGAIEKVHMTINQLLEEDAISEDQLRASFHRIINFKSIIGLV